MRQATREELAYCAGVIDSDGCITISRGAKKRKTMQSRRFVPIIRLGQIHCGATKLFKNLFGGSVYYYQRTKDVFPNARPMYSWVAASQAAAKVLRLLIPFLRIKRRQALIAIRCADVLTESRKEFFNQAKLDRFRGRKKRFEATLDRLTDQCQRLNGGSRLK